MRQFDVHRNPSEAGRATAPLVVILQSHHLHALSTVIVAPLVKPELVTPDGLVALSVEVGAQTYTLDLALMGGVASNRLGAPVGELRQYEDAIRRGLDRPFTGF